MKTQFSYSLWLQSARQQEKERERIRKKILTFCEDLVSRVPTYDLYFKPSIEVVDVFEQFVSARP